MSAGAEPVLSLIVPVHDEGPTLRLCLERLGAVDLGVPWELIVVDDGSTDGAPQAIERTWVPGAERIVVARTRTNRGKGSALRHGLGLARGAVLGVQDADLEYDPRDLPALLEPILDGTADAVFGTRQFGAQTAYSFWYVVGNRLLSLVASALFDRYLTDAYTGYKLLTREVYERLRLTADGFEIEAELTAGVLAAGARVAERPIRYAARSRAEGKKIRPSDGVRGLLRLLRVRVRGW